MSPTTQRRTAVRIKHFWLTTETNRATHPRPEAYGRALSVTYPDGTGRRYEFDYDDHAIYVYSAAFTASGQMTGNYAPVRTIPRRPH